MPHENKEFLHITGDEGFQNRAKSVFEGLDSLEPSKQSGESRSRANSRAVKRRRPNQVPDHVLNPGKWTKYSLEEDGSQSLGRMSANEVNRHAALSFLDELKKRKKSSEKNSLESKFNENQNVTDSASHHAFEKPSPKNVDSTPKNVIIKQGVNVMPEYVVGKTKNSAKSKKIIASANSSSDTKTADIHISHLLHEDGEKDDIDDMSIDKQKCGFSKSKPGKKRNIRKQRPNDDDE